jgi:hypothetical protein
MSINDFFNKIKSKFNLDKITILNLLIIIGVGISSFGLGRFSIEKRLVPENGISITYNEPESSQVTLNKNNISTYSSTSISQEEKRYVASKNGKMYYSLGCGGAKRIKPENEVWFKTSEDAEKAGYQRSSQCK